MQPQSMADTATTDARNVRIKTLTNFWKATAPKVKASQGPSAGQVT